jgi:hypothetical protein
LGKKKQRFGFPDTQCNLLYNSVETFSGESDFRKDLKLTEELAANSMQNTQTALLRHADDLDPATSRPGDSVAKPRNA